MSESSGMLRSRWKGLKDSYIKYQRQAEESTGGKYINCSTYYKWRWAENFIQFLEMCGHSHSRQSKSSILRISSVSLHDCSLDSELPPSIQIVSTTSIPRTASLETGTVYLKSSETLPKDCVPGTRPLTTAQTAWAMKSFRLSEPPYTWKSSSKTNYRKSAHDGDKTHLKRKKHRETSGAIDLLFKSYAETFKSFSAKKRVSVKVKLAKLFADAELEDMKQSSVGFSTALIPGEHGYTLGTDDEPMKHSPDSTHPELLDKEYLTAMLR